MELLKALGSHFIDASARQCPMVSLCSSSVYHGVLLDHVPHVENLLLQWQLLESELTVFTKCYRVAPVRVAHLQPQAQYGVSYKMSVCVHTYPGMAHHYVCAYQLYRKTKAWIALVCPTLVSESMLINLIWQKCPRLGKMITVVHKSLDAY